MGIGARLGVELVIERSSLVGLGLALWLAGCGGEGPYLQAEYFETKPGESEEGYFGGSCMRFDSAGSSSGSVGSGTLGDPVLYEERYESSGDTVRYEIRDGAGTLLARRNYDEPFIDSGKRDEVTITLDDGHQFRFVHWGTEDCAIGAEPITKP